MDLRTIVTPGLGDSTYLLGVGGVGLVVDPQRDIDRFEAAVDDMGIEVRWVLETHLHNDYVSGANDLARSLGAELVIPAGAAPVYRHRPAFHQEELTSSGLTIRPLHTPGHTPEHMAYVVVSEGEEVAVFSGGSLLVGSAGRSDLLGPERAETLARLQYISINRLAGLPDTTGLYPTHGAGSFCTATVATSGASDIGTEKKTNAALAHGDEESFVASHLSGLPDFPSYYRFMGATNLVGLPAVDLHSPPQLSETEYLALGPDVTTIDARPKRDFADGHISGSINVGLRDDFGVWVGWVTEFGSKLVLVMNRDQDTAEAVRQLARIGYDDVIGVVSDLESWEMDLVGHDIVDLESLMAKIGQSQVLDVRAPSEWESGVIDDSILAYAPEVIARPPAGLDPTLPVVVVCGTGYRASLAASFLHRHGYQPVVLAEVGVPEVLAGLNK